MRKKQYLISRTMCVIVSLFLAMISIFLCGQRRMTFFAHREKSSTVAVGPKQPDRKISEKLTLQEIRSVSGVHKQSEALNEDVQPKNRLPVFLLFLFLTELIWRCHLKCQWVGHIEFKEKTYFYSSVSKRRGPPISVVQFR